jgi:iron complex outermembrane receptor protein
MTETILSRSLRRLFAGSAAAGVALFGLPALAQPDQPAPASPPAQQAQADQTAGGGRAPVDQAPGTSQPQSNQAPLASAPDQPPQSQAPMQRVEITGSSIKRLASETSLPVTTIRAADFIKQGLATAQEVLSTIPTNQTSVVGASAVGAGTGGRATADLRGLGGNKTLVLLNGRRLANHPYFADTVDLNIIPVAALDRVEILRDGASAIYGTDAVGGVINFITKRSYQGAAALAEDYEPLRSGGGAEQRFNLSGGYGDLNRDGYSMFGVVDWHQQTAMKSTDRGFSSTGIIPEHGFFQSSRTTFPANFFSANGVSGNPFWDKNCAPPGTQPTPTGRPANFPAVDGSPLCEFDYTQFIDNIPKTSQFNAMGKFNMKFGEHLGSIEIMHGRATTLSRVAPPPMSNLGIIMHSTSRYYPGNGIVPAFTPPASDPTGLVGEDLDIAWRPLESGQRENFDSSTTDRLLGSLEGTLYGWDYSTALYHSLGKARSSFTHGYLNDQRIIDGVGSGLLNPFGFQDTPEAQAYLANSQLIGEYLHARINSSAFDAHASRELMALPGGPLGFAVGLEARHDKATYKVNRPLASQASSSGFADAQDQAGSRSIYAIFAEVNAPIIKDLELNVAVREDKYTDVGKSFNPKVSLRYQPIREVLLRASFNKGFRAPTLFDLFGPNSVTFSSDTHDDPRLCPGGNPIPGANPSIVCGQQQFLRLGGNPNLQPEHSRNYSAGVVFEPMPTLTMSMDYWNIKVKDLIEPLAEQVIFGDPVKYANLFVYDAAGTSLLYVIDTTSNLGELHTDGVDLSLLYRLPNNPLGTLTVSADGTYVNTYKYQNERGGGFVNNAGRYTGANPIFRWRHNLLITLARGDWVYNLSNRYESHYQDQNTSVDPQFYNNVKHYSTWALSTTYRGNKQFELTAGIKNLFDEAPPFTNQVTNFQLGYDPRYTDPLGRTVYMRLTYKFF